MIHPARRIAMTAVTLAVFTLAAAAGIAASMPAAPRAEATPPDPLLDGLPLPLCNARGGARPALLQALVRAQSETRPFPPQPVRAEDGAVPLYKNLGTLSLPAGTRDATAQAYFDQGLRWAFAFNHAEAQRAFRAAQQRDPAFALAYWGEAFVLGPNINAPMPPEAVAPAWQALSRALALAPAAPARDRALIDAARARYRADAGADRVALDAAFADAMQRAAAEFPDDDTVLALYAEAIMDTQPWDYWEAGGSRPKGRAADALAALETVLARNPDHVGALHLYLHAVEASAAPERALPHAQRLADLMPGAGHIVHMPAHIFHRLGMYRESLQINRRAMAVDEAYFRTSPSDPMYRSAYYPHNIHFVMVSAQMGGDGAVALDAAGRLDAVLDDAMVAQYPVLEPIKAAPYLTHALFSTPAAVLALPAPPATQTLVTALAHHVRALALTQSGAHEQAQQEIDAIARIGDEADFSRYDAAYVPARDVVRIAQHVATARLADAQHDPAAAAAAYEAAIAIEDTLAYMEPPYWHYPVRQSLGAVYLRQGRLDEAERVLRESLLRVRGNGAALAVLAEVYRRKGDAQAERAARRALARAWFGATAPDLARL